MMVTDGDCGDELVVLQVVRWRIPARHENGVTSATYGNTKSATRMTRLFEQHMAASVFSAMFCK